MFLLVCLISGPAGAGSGEDSPSYVLQVHKVTSGEDGHNFITDIWFLCHVATWSFHVVTSILHASVTSRRGHVATWTSHVATSIFTFSATSRRAFSRRDVNLYKPLSRRDIAPNVATSLSYMLSHVATLTRTSRRWLHYSLSRRDVDPHVATWPCFKPKTSSFLALHLTQPTT